MSSIKVPSINMEFTEQFASETYPTARYIWENYKDFILKNSKELGVDPVIIIGFMIVESGRFDGSGSVNPGAISPVGARGLMQVMPKTAFDTLEAQAPVMSGRQVVVVQRYLPGFIKVQGFTGFYKDWESKISDALLKPEFNILVGTMQLAQLMKYSIKLTGTLNLAQVVVMYNAGVGNYDKWVVKNKLQKADSAALVKGLQVVQGLKESRQYIVKLLGINGALVAAMKGIQKKVL